MATTSLRSCAWCGEDMDDLTGGRKYCSPSHRTAMKNCLRRQRRIARDRVFANGPTVGCKWAGCNVEIRRMAGRGRQRRYCDDHRLAADAANKKKWVALNRDQHRTTTRTYQARRRREVPDLCNEQRSLWRDRNRARLREQGRNATALRRLRNSSVGRHLSAEELRAAWIGVGIKPDVCLYCGKPSSTIDHVVAIKNGGDHLPRNVVPACRSCNASKHTRIVEDWLPIRRFRLGLTAWSASYILTQIRALAESDAY